MKVVTTGQLFYGRNSEAGPMFSINYDEATYTARIISHLTGEILAKEKGFSTVGEAFEWVYTHSDW